MPYRRLPTTDRARLRALDAALNMASTRDAGKLAFSKSTVLELKEVKTNFENHLRQYEFDMQIESERSADYKAAFEKAKLYVSHFIQVLYMNIEREELKEEVLPFYGLEFCEGKIPPMNTEQEILEWGKKVMQGEQKRLEKGGSPVYNPSVALVKVNVENFYEAAVFQQNLKRNTLRSYEKMVTLRRETNSFISKLWTEIEDNVENITPRQKRQRAEEYGVVYVYRRNEKKRIRSEGIQVDLLFDFN
jgi:hypothetical protein